MGVGLFILLDALLLVASGAGMILYSIRTRRKLIGRRVDAIRPAATGLAKSTRKGREAPLIRLKSQGFAQQEEREIIRLMAWFGVPHDRALGAFSVARVVSAIVAAILSVIGYQ